MTAIGCSRKAKKPQPRLHLPDHSDTQNTRRRTRQTSALHSSSHSHLQCIESIGCKYHHLCHGRSFSCLKRPPDLSSQCPPTLRWGGHLIQRIMYAPTHLLWIHTFWQLQGGTPELAVGHPLCFLYWSSWAHPSRNLSMELPLGRDQRALQVLCHVALYGPYPVRAVRIGD